MKPLNFQGAIYFPGSSGYFREGAENSRNPSRTSVRVSVSAFLWILTMALLAPVQVLWATPYEDLTKLQTDVEQHLKAYYQQAGAVKLEVEVTLLDRRLQLARCPQPLAFKVNDPGFAGGHQTVLTRCDSAAPWSVYVPAQINLFRRVPVASRNLERGAVVTQGDLMIEVVNVSQLRQGQYMDAEAVVGKEVKRSINKGEPFRTAALDAPLAIKRGDQVAIELSTGAISVHSQGTAMANGRIGERIRVRNNQSDRLVTAEVVAPGKVITRAP